MYFVSKDVQISNIFNHLIHPVTAPVLPSAHDILVHSFPGMKRQPTDYITGMRLVLYMTVNDLSNIALAVLKELFVQTKIT